MKFSKPISREVDIDGNTFIVSFDDNGIDFRVKGKRKTAHVDWTRVLEIAEGEDGARALEFLGLSASGSDQQSSNEPERQEQIFAPQTTGTETGNPQSQESGGNQAEASQGTRPQSSEDDADSQEELGRAVTAGEVGPES